MAKPLSKKLSRVMSKLSLQSVKFEVHFVFNAPNSLIDRFVSLHARKEKDAQSDETSSAPFT